MGKKILLVESDRQYLKVLEQYVAEMEIFDSYRIATDGDEAAALAMEYQPDILVTGLVLSGLDGFGLIALLKEQFPRMRFVISSALKSDFAVNQANDLGVHLYFAKPTSFTSFRDQITRLTENAEGEQNLMIRKEDPGVLWLITREIQKLGFPPNVKGFKFVRYAIYLRMEDELPRSVMHVIYPAVAEKFDTTVSCVERNIRHGIEKTWIQGSMSYIDEVFGFTVDADKGKPTNSAFIETMADRVRLQT